GETVPEEAPEEPAPQPKAVAPSEDVCPGAEPVETSTGGPGNQYTAAFEITGESFVLSYHATPADPADEEGTLVMDLVDTEGGTTVETVRAKSEEPEQTPTEVGPGTYTVNVYSDNRNYEVTAYDCAGLAAPAGEPAPPAPEEETPEATTAPAPDDNLGIPGAAPEATPAAAPEDAAEPQPEAGFELPAAPEEQTVPDAQEEEKTAALQEEPAAEPKAESAPPETAPVADEEAAELQPAALRTPPQSTATAQPAALPTRQTQKGVVAVLPETGGEPAPALALAGAAPIERAERVAAPMKPVALVAFATALILAAATRRKHKAGGATTPLSGPFHEFVFNFRPLHVALAMLALAFLADGVGALGLPFAAAMAAYSVALFGVLGLLLLGHRRAAPERADGGGAAPPEGQRG
ncbi:MAG: hypothetical protein M3R38_34350, partial [Actinomycetota bacterium]|nr:hypothetical protein [Actinomycetota bacterium]